MAQFQFNAAAVVPDTGRGDPLPAGWYIVAAEKSEMKPTSDGQGAFLEFVFGVVDGQFVGRKLFARFNVRNNNAQAQEIAYKQFSALCHAIGHLQVNDTSELHGRPLKVRVKIRPAEGQYEASNDITAYKNVNEQTPANQPPTLTNVVPMHAAQPAIPPQAAPQGWGQPPAAAVPPAATQFAMPPQAAPAAMPAQAPAWQPPAGAQPQPWAQQPSAAAPVQAAAAPQVPPQPPAGQPQPWSPPPAGVAQPAAAVPPWAQAK